MRTCSRCHQIDKRVIRRAESCTCGAPGAEYAQDDDHDPGCHRVGHYVMDWPFPTVLRHKDLVKDASASHGYILPLKWRKDWRLVERPDRIGTFARVRMLCRDCITLEVEVADRIRDYEMCLNRMAPKKESKGWARTMAMQDGI